jgi:hypothetical protein
MACQYLFVVEAHRNRKPRLFHRESAYGDDDQLITTKALRRFA